MTYVIYLCLFYDIYFYAWDIFEKFVRTILSNFLIDRFIVNKTVGRSIERIGISLENKFSNHPDIMIYNKNDELKLKLILDAKYKHDIAKSDFEQAGNCVRELMIDPNLPIKDRNCILVYPSSANTASEEQIITIGKSIIKNSNRAGSIYAFPIDLDKVNEDEYITNWVRTIEDNFL